MSWVAWQRAGNGQRLTAGRAATRHGGRRATHAPAAVVARERETERTRLAVKIDADLRAACRADVAARRELGALGGALVARRGFVRLGFVRAADYARERLGVSARTLQVASWVVDRLAALPLIEAALDHGEITWTQARAICRAAQPDDQPAWLARARELGAARLDALVRTHGRADCPEDPDDEPAEIDGEPGVRLRLRCPARLRALWRHAVAVASRVAGEPLPAWRAAELVAAESFAGRPADASFGDRALLAALRLARRTRRLSARIATAATADADDTGDSHGLVPPARRPDASPRLNSSTGAYALHRPDPPRESRVPSADPFALDARLRNAVAALRANEPRIGRLLRLLLDHRLYRSFGYGKLDAYVRERLAISPRKAWALVAVERRVRPIAALAEHYDAGRVSWVAMLTLLPVVDRDNAAAWLARAEAVTLRRLIDEVNWVLEARDLRGWRSPLDPPPPDVELIAPVTTTTVEECRETSLATGLQIGAPGAQATASAPAAVTGRDECRNSSLGEVSDAEIAFTAPSTVVALFRDTMHAFGSPSEPRWYALERMLHHVVAYWESAPPHRDPVFARDGWRCTVPTCSSRRNLHDHHVLYRSRGGGDARANRTTVCAAHHLHGIHGGTIRVFGTAPSELHWELGLRSNAPPLLRYVGDRRIDD